VGTITFAEFSGFQGDGSTGYINSQFAPTDGVNYTLNSATFGVILGNNVQSNAVDIGTRTNTPNRISIILPRNTSDIFITTNNTSGTNTNVSSITDSKAYFLNGRTGATTGSAFYNTTGTAYTTSSTALSTQPFAVGAYNVNGTPVSFSTRIIVGYVFAEGWDVTGVTVFVNSVEGGLDILGVGILD